MPRWVGIILKDPAGMKTYENVTRYYWKGGELCLELTERGPNGYPLIVGHPKDTIHNTFREHLPHPGMEERESKGKTA